MPVVSIPHSEQSMSQATVAPSPPPEYSRLAMTYEEWLAWPDGESTQSEWVDGDVIVFMPPKTAHALLGFFLARLLAS